MGENATARLIAFGGDRQYQYAHFTLTYGLVSVQMHIEKDGSVPFKATKDEYQKLLYEVALAALQAAKSSEALLWPDHFPRPS